MSKLLKVEKRDHTAVITMNNPPANTWTPDSLNYLKQLVEELTEDKENYALVIASESEKFFCAGADLKEFHHNDSAKAAVFATAFGEAFQALSDYNGVSIAAITGYAMGGGLEVALSCDIRICEQQAQMALPEAAVGLLPCGLGSQQLSWLVGEQWAKRMILLGERLKPDQAEKIGLVSEVVPTGTVLDRALELAAKTANQSPTSIRFCKELIMQARTGSMDDACAMERDLFVRLWDTQDQKEGVGAFLEKRPPDWKNC